MNIADLAIMLNNSKEFKGEEVQIVNEETVAQYYIVYPNRYPHLEIDISYNGYLTVSLMTDTKIPAPGWRYCIECYDTPKELIAALTEDIDSIITDLNDRAELFDAREEQSI